ncbi:MULTISPECIES: hypothetical protein [unclassified Streptomyces]|uniref:hypothetical protein n=1 Tax=unclassified Streptomyces TaxID=2593676 RepID=UPI000DD7786D|nr:MULTISPECIES: hypothetical protein [unclassified Streptomyces]QZZ26584.1 hypothetical protein A7X85_10225 [Streptomyces sp. ST1015]
MAATKAPPAPIPTDKLEQHFNVAKAAAQLGLTDPDNPDDKTGHRWLRDGFNRPEDGSKGRKFPGFYMGRELMFSESDLVVITQIAREETVVRQRAKDQMPVSTGRPRRLRRMAGTPALVD